MEFSDQQNNNNNWMQVIIILLYVNVFTWEIVFVFKTSLLSDSTSIYLIVYYISSYIFCFNIFTKTTFKLFLSLVSYSIYIILVIIH